MAELDRLWQALPAEAREALVKFLQTVTSAKVAVANPTAPASTRALPSLHEGWLELVGRVKWDWMGTLTFPDVVDSRTADRVFKVWVSKANRAAYGRRWLKHKQGVQWVRASERQIRGVLHYHVLLARVGNLQPSSCVSDWRAIKGGLAKITRVKSQKAVARYVTKVVHIGGELEVGGNWSEEDTKLVGTAKWKGLDQSQSN